MSRAEVGHLRHVSDEPSVAHLRNDLTRTLSNEQTKPTSPTESMKPPPLHHHHAPPQPRQTSMSIALNDTPDTTAPSSPRIHPHRQNSGSSTPRIRPTTLDIPGLTKSKVSPDGRIASRDVGAKMVIVMVGLPARGKSYITKKLARYLNWLQHDTKIFNVGERRRVAAGGPNTLEKIRSRQGERNGSLTLTSFGLPPSLIDHRKSLEMQPSSIAARIMLNGDTKLSPPGTPDPASRDEKELSLNYIVDEPESITAEQLAALPTPALPDVEQMDQSADFFDPFNKKAALMREQYAMETLDDLLDYILEGNGSVGILDATNSTLERRIAVLKKIREREPALNVLFLESQCLDENLLESNMRLKLSGPDYKDKDPVSALDDFKRRVEQYQKKYVGLGDYEEKHNIPYIQMIDVGRKIISHQIKGFLMAQANYYLLNFNLAPRQIWITRHGQSMDNLSGKIGGDSALSPEGERYAKTLMKFMEHQRHAWEQKQLNKQEHSHFPPEPGDTTPPNPHYQDSCDPEEPRRPFCVWTSMLKRSLQTAQFFDEEEYDVKQMRMLDELNAGTMEGLTYANIAVAHPHEYQLRKRDKLHYRYPGPGGEGYLDIINRLRPVIVELERMTDNALLVAHRSVARVLLAYFRGLDREVVADLDVPIGMLYCLEPKPYGVDFKAYRWDRELDWFYEQPDFQLQRAKDELPY